jgi:hypothetical protein
MGVSILQHKGNKLNSTAIGKKPWPYRIGKPQGFISFRSASGIYALLATAEPFVEIFFRWARVFYNTRAIN